MNDIQKDNKPQVMNKPSLPLPKFQSENSYSWLIPGILIFLGIMITFNEPEKPKDPTVDYRPVRMEAKLSTYVWSEEWVQSGLYPNQFFDQLSKQRQDHIVENLESLKEKYLRKN